MRSVMLEKLSSETSVHMETEMSQWACGRQILGPNVAVASDLNRALIHDVNWLFNGAKSCDGGESTFTVQNTNAVVA